MLNCDRIFGIVESVLTWFDPATSPEPAAVSATIAETVLRIVAIPARQHPRIKREAGLAINRFLKGH